MSQNTLSQGQVPDWREMRRQAREERRAARGGGAWITGAVLILIGGLLLLQNFGMPILFNWWALFILIPAAACLTTAWRNFSRVGERWSAAVSAPAIVGLALLALTAALLFDLTVAWGVLGPVFLILLGAGALLDAFASHRP